MKTKKIVIDPITRIEGHLRAEVEVDENGVVVDAYVSGQLFRGIEVILKNRDPRDAGLLAGRICGVCTNSHFRALIMISHYLEALKFQTTISKAVAIFGGKTPHPQSIVVGGVTSVADMLNPQRLNDYLFIIKNAKDFIDRAYLPDAKLLAIAYRDEIKAGVGRANGNFMSVGGYEFDDGKLFCDGVIHNHDFETIEDFDESKITEEIDRAWYKNEPLDNEVNYTDLNEDGSLKTAKNDDKYSWIKAPRYGGKVMETGPLARVLISYKKENPLIKSFVDEFLKDTDLELLDLSSTVGRNGARAIETGYICEYIFKLISRLIQNIKYYDTDTWVKFDFDSLKKEAKGRAFFEVPRGVLSHFVKIKDAKIENFSVIAPTTWNATPKNFDGVRGAYEEALVGLKIEDTSKPLEVLRVLHSFDPCLACAVHVIDAKGKELSRCKIKI